jgi:integrase
MRVVLSYTNVLEKANLPARLKEELHKLFEKHLIHVHSKTRVTSNAISLKTQQRRVTNLIAGFKELRAGGFALETPWNVGEKHIRYLVNLWVLEKKLSPGTVDNRLTYWRTLAGWMKKNQLVGTVDDYIDRPDGYRRYYVAQQDKSWEAANINVEEVFSRLTERDRWVAIQVELQSAFGLRVEESMRLRPLQCLRLTGHLQIVDGTKGGRPRLVPIDSQHQYDLLVRAGLLSNPRTGSMIPEPWTFKKWYRHFYDVLQSEDISKRKMGVTVHGLRHAYLQRMYEQVTGVPAPIKRLDHRPDLELHQRAMEKIVEAAGHSMVSKAHAYISTFAAMKKTEAPVITQDQAAHALDLAHGNKSEAARTLGVSRQAFYRLVAQKFVRTHEQVADLPDDHA